MRKEKELLDPHAHRKEYELRRLADRLRSDWPGPGSAPDERTTTDLYLKAFNLLWNTAKQQAGPATMIRTAELRPDLYLVACTGPSALTLNVHTLITALTAALRHSPGPLAEPELPSTWADSITHNARVLVLTVERMFSHNLDKDAAQAQVLRELLEQHRYPHINLLLKDGSFEQLTAVPR